MESQKHARNAPPFHPTRKKGGRIPPLLDPFIRMESPAPRLPVFPFGIGIVWFTPPMQPLFAAVLIMLTTILCPVARAGAKADKKASISVHLETENTENPKMIFQQDIGNGTRWFRRMPEVSTKEIIAFSPFPSEAGGDFGCVFRLKPNVAGRLSAITSANQNRWLLIMVNGRAVDAVLIDRQIDDGLIVAWKGITLADIAIFEEKMPRIGQEGAKKKKKD
jgi:hypothetical protein